MAPAAKLDCVNALGSCPLFVGLSAAELAAMVDVCTARRLPAGTAIYTEHDRCVGLWVLAQGSAKLHQSAPDGRQHVVGFASAPAALLLGATIDGMQSTETATTLGPVRALLFPRPAFLELLRHRPATAVPAMQQLCAELRVRNIIGGVGAFKDARQRLACRLLQLARGYGRPAGTGVRIDLRLTRRDLANSVDVALETAIRALSPWERHGLIRTHDRMIEIHDIAALRLVAGCDACLFDCSVFGPPPEAVA